MDIQKMANIISGRSLEQQLSTNLPKSDPLYQGETRFDIKVSGRRKFVEECMCRMLQPFVGDTVNLTHWKQAETGQGSRHIISYLVAMGQSPL